LESHKTIKFALTGSSARKLKRGGANLLAGRANLNYLFPMTPFELKKDFELDSALTWGSLPELYTMKRPIEKREYLKSYVGTYIREEIKEEQWVRNVDPFVKFLETSAQMSGEILNYASIGRNSGVDGKAIERYFEILSDTLLGFFLMPFDRSIRKRQSQKAKFYYFDLGVKNVLQGRFQKEEGAGYGYGRDFEHFILQNFMTLNSYFRRDYQVSYFKSKDNLEIDLIVEQGSKVSHLIEIKSARRVDETVINQLSRLKNDFTSKPEAWILCQEAKERKVGNVWVLPWKSGLERMFF
jgi:predicted AAA+ superfamily ATPase